MSRVWNFSAGPSVLPESVLRQAAAEMLDYRGSGQSVMEMSHRSKVFMGIASEAEARMRSLMKIPDSYKLLFLQGGASTQFSMVPLNLMGPNGRADYVNTGAWSKKAGVEAEKYGTVRTVADASPGGFTEIPNLDGVDWDPKADYAHITTNNTIFGTAFSEFPNTGSVPLVADMSSNILSEPIDVSRFGLIYAGAQKNAGPAGLTLVIIREDLIGHAHSKTPQMLDYAIHAKTNSMYNTPPCYPLYIAGLVFNWLQEMGGLEEIGRRNHEKARLLYDFLDNANMFSAPVKAPHRSIMNVPFHLADPSLDAAFLAETEQQGLVNLKGHRSVGGMRASLYNGMPLAGVGALVDFMADFEKRHGA